MVRDSFRENAPIDDDDDEFVGEFEDELDDDAGNLDEDDDEAHMSE